MTSSTLPLLIITDAFRLSRQSLLLLLSLPLRDTQVHVGLKFYLQKSCDFFNLEKIVLMHNMKAGCVT